MHRIPPSLAVAERVARAVFQHELSEQPLYIVTPAIGSLVPPGMLGEHKGVYARGLDSALRPQLESEGRWRGAGVAIIIDTFLIFGLAADDDAGQRSIIGAVLHELCHWIDMGEPTEVGPDQYEKFVAGCEAAKHPPAEPQEFPPDFLAHSETFTRLACHVWWRCRTRGGVVLAPRYLRFGSDYAGLEMLPSPEQFIDALWDELEAFEDCPLRKIAASEQPATYTKLWNETLTRIFLPATNAA